MRLLIALIILLPFFAEAQLIDDFSDGDFSANPSWTGDTGLFQVNTSNQLQLNDIAAGQAQIRTPYSPANLDNTEWIFYIRQSFSPSGNNNSRVYLTSDQADLSASLNGYFLQFGEAGSNDAIELFYQNGTSSTSVARGTEVLLVPFW
ncbi:MAG: hypothetical protein HKN22_01905 [Bacteroidia bacterium]|nr:hypothetical protein [Bacteroidia bacterium]